MLFSTFYSSEETSREITFPESQSKIQNKLWIAPESELVAIPVWFSDAK